MSDISNIETDKKSLVLEQLGNVIFSIRWFLAPIYFGLFISMVVYIVRFYQEIFHFLGTYGDKSSEEILIWVLQLIDISMIGNLIVMTTIGGWSTFVKPITFIKNTPRWMHGLDSNSLKIKTGLSLISVTAIHLLKTFMEAKSVSVQQVALEIIIHLVFIVTTLALTFNTWMHHKAQAEDPHASTSSSSH